MNKKKSQGNIADEPRRGEAAFIHRLSVERALPDARVGLKPVHRRVIFCIHVFFFFKHKTAYEMSIGDWSSDVCSSDLYAREGVLGALAGAAGVDPFPRLNRAQ